jgi:hypothetical protein
VSRRTRTAVLAAAAVAVLAALPSSAGAAFTSPTAADFGGVPVGTTSPPQTVTLTADCSNLLPGIPPICVSGSTTDLVNVNPVTTGDFAIGNNACPAGLGPTLVDGTSQSCTISVTFNPTAAGARVGTLSVGTTGVGGLTPGPVVALSGDGLASTASSPSGATNPRAKKCKKKKRAAQSAKKRRCKKKKR